MNRRIARQYETEEVVFAVLFEVGCQLTSKICILYVLFNVDNEDVRHQFRRPFQFVCLA